jgi:hypothetical protein
MEFTNLKFSGHAIRRMFERSISRDQVVEAIRKGEVFQEYPDDRPFPSVVIYFMIDNRPLHVVVGYDASSGAAVIITVYEPGMDLWSPDFKRRKKS